LLLRDSLTRARWDVLGLEARLPCRLQFGQFVPLFQPLVRPANPRRGGLGTLVRRDPPGRGVLLPGDFLPVAEECGLLDAIDWQMYRNACEAGRDLMAEGRYMTINVAPRHFQGNDLDSRLLEVTAAGGFDPASLRVEVTEGTLLGDPESVANQLLRLQHAGISAALDDFGTGYCSLGYVHRFPLRMLKIDRSFIEPLGEGTSRRSSAVVTAILALASSLGLDVLAEGIETEAQHDALRAMGCTFGQGYLYGKPQPASHWLAQEYPRALSA